MSDLDLFGHEDSIEPPVILHVAWKDGLLQPVEANIEAGLTTLKPASPVELQAEIAELLPGRTVVLEFVPLEVYGPAEGEPELAA